MLNVLTTTITQQTKNNWPLYFIWAVYLGGIAGIMFIDKDIFLSLTPMTLLLGFGMLLYFHPQKTYSFFLSTILIYSIGFLSEFLGVKWGWIFGNYTYGENLGLKVGGVPLTIGINWFVLTYVTGSMAQKWVSNKPLSILLGASGMVLLDLIIEPVAPKLDFWYWENGTPPIQNFIGWFVVSLVVQTIFQLESKKTQVSFSKHLLLCQIIFFGVFCLLNV